ncbi:MAG: MFS transporter [Rhizorhabdus sp.]|uniref:MFS transporter n=1 Tax=Rhizorhabdus sp. TaxID=1968843 RepID=UPI001B47B423|nr:MFS transporter [Rhizorhabdus sp.]MBP8235201.1 MFS transporter [Rhizorhabdus sp.]
MSIADPSARAAVTPARAWGALTLLSALYIVSFVDRLILALLIEPIKADLGISDVQMGLLIGTSFALVFSIAGLPLARLADTGNRVMLIFVGAVGWGISTAAAAFADSFAVLLLLRIGVAVGEAALTPAAMSLLSDMFPPAKRALPISIYVMVGVCGGSGAMLVGAAAIQAAAGMQGDAGILGSLSAWRLTLLFVGLPAVVLALLIPFVIPRVPRGGAVEVPKASMKDVMAHYRANRVT